MRPGGNKKGKFKNMTHTLVLTSKIPSQSRTKKKRKGTKTYVAKKNPPKVVTEFYSQSIDPEGKKNTNSATHRDVRHQTWPGGPTPGAGGSGCGGVIFTGEKSKWDANAVEGPNETTRGESRSGRLFGTVSSYRELGGCHS